ncbi:MAG: ABC-F family ATP-binding cassette domain-containing protein, partial [Lachnospiraceae bacterium]|nr:ABC-F family ATP-binding cassette domain-containing protein [Lachnospiraceae bacterium]
MSQISVTNLTYCYEGSFDNIFENVSFTLDTDWKLGFIGRNGKGKTTFLDILMGKYFYTGSITASSRFDYFPYQITPDRFAHCAAEFMEELKAGCEAWKVICELGKLGADAELLFRPFGTLSHGERTKVLLAILFSEENEFLLIDEPTNHLDQQAREVVKQYLSGKKGFILVSHDRDILDACVDHVLVLNRKTIEVQNGNFSSWWENKNRADNFAKAENEKHIREISILKKAADRSSRWAEKSENSKIGFDPQKEHDRNIATRAYIGSKTKKMQSRVKQFEHRIENEIKEKEGLLQNIESPTDLKLNPLRYHKELLAACKNLNVAYPSGQENVLCGFSFEIKQGERIFLHGENGCGKSTLIKTILEQAGSKKEEIIITGGEIKTGAGIIISYIDQDTGSMYGTIDDFCQTRRLEKSLFLSLLRQLDLERVQFTKRLEDFSEGQKKKVLIASSLM